MPDFTWTGESYGNFLLNFFLYRTKAEITGWLFDATDRPRG